VTPLGTLIFVVLFAAMLVAWGHDEPRPRLHCSPRPVRPSAGHPARAGDPDRDSAPAVNGSPVAARGRRTR
jgi:hypothetical protein